MSDPFLQHWHRAATLIPYPKDGQGNACAVETVTCEQWESMLPCIHRQIAAWMPKANQSIDLGGKKYRYVDGIKALRELVAFIKEMCKDEGEDTFTLTPSGCERDCPCPGQRPGRFL